MIGIGESAGVEFLQVSRKVVDALGIEELTKKNRLKFHSIVMILSLPF